MKKRAAENFKMNYQLSYLLILLILVLSLGIVFEVEVNSKTISSLDVTLEFPAYASFIANPDKIETGDSGFLTETENDLWSEFIIEPDKPLTVEVPNPKKQYLKSLEWKLLTNYPNAVLSFSSIGYDGDDYNCLTDSYIYEFISYTIRDFNTFIETFRPGGFVENISFHNGTFEMKYDPNLSDKLWCANEAGQYRDIILVTISADPYYSVQDTAFGGDSPGGGNPWWYYFDTNIGGAQTIIAGRHLEAGTVRYNQNQIIINLDYGWYLKEREEAVKIQGFDTIPGSRPAPGLFTTYKGNDLIITVPPYRYYVIQLDLQYY